MDDGIVQLETDARKLVEDYAATSPYELNQDSKHVDKIKGFGKEEIEERVFLLSVQNAF